MRSIRWSLLTYFLVLLGLAMTVMSILVYQSMRDTVMKKREADTSLRRNQHEEQQTAVNNKLDEHLLNQVRLLANLAQFQFNADFMRVRFVAPVGQWFSSVGAVPGWSSMINTGVTMGRIPLLEPLYPSNSTTLQFDENALNQDTDPHVMEYFQVDSNLGKARWRSQSMGSFAFPVEPNIFRNPAPILRYKTQLCAILAYAPCGPLPLLPALALKQEDALQPTMLVPHVSDTKLPSGTLMRRVTMLVPVSYSTVRFFVPRPPYGSRDRGSERPYFTVYIQCACETKERDNKLASLDQQFENDLEDINDESQARLTSLRKNLLLICLATFMAAALGGYFIVWLGLSPLHRVSDAVSRVSVKDFLLPLGSKPLPVELRPIVTRLRETLGLLQRAFTREKQAAADISHELRTPVAVILTTTEVALRKPRSNEEYREVLEECHATGKQMHRLVERLLALARLDAGVDIIRTKEVDVAALGEECVSLVRPLADVRRLKLTYHRNGPIRFRTDVDKLREVLNNLLHNAIQYNRVDGSVELMIGRENGRIHLEVRDTGIGIEPTAREHIFERFYRADPSRQADNMNTGLGLSIVKGYIDLLGGSISVDSTLGKGSTFSIDLPSAIPPKKTT